MSDETRLETIRARRDYADAEWRDIRNEARTDRKVVAGDPWDKKDRDAREAASRPVLSLDELGQYFNQVINDVRANPRGMTYSPLGNGANDAGAEFYADKFREIEYRSQAQIAYTTAFENTIHGGYGWVRVKTKYESPRSLNQELWIDEIPNPDLILPDPHFKRPNFSDGKYLFVIEPWDIKEAVRTFGKDMKVQSFGVDVQKLAPAWVKPEKIDLAEYWDIEDTLEQLIVFQAVDGQLLGLFASELDKNLNLKPLDAVQVGSRDNVEVPKVTSTLTNGVEILKTTPWQGKYLPFASCVGKVLYPDQDGTGAKRVLMSMTRLARDPYMLYCYYRTQQAEMAGMIPKVPVMGYKGQFAGLEHDWQKAPHEPLAFLEAHATVEGTPPGVILPLPTRLAYSAGEHLQALELCAEGARRAIQAAMGVSPLPTQAQRRNEKSGVALQEIKESGERGSFHFNDHYQDMIQHVGCISEDLITHIIDVARDTPTRKANGDTIIVRVNDPAKPGKDGQPISTKGDYIGTVSTGPAVSSQREAADQFTEQLAGNPQAFPLVAAIIAKHRGLGVQGDELAEALKVLQPPELRQKDKDGQAVPPEVAAAQLQIQELQQQLQQAVEALKTEQAKQQATIEKAERDNATKLEITNIEAQNARVMQAFEQRFALLIEKMNEAHETALEAMKAKHAEDAHARQADAAHQMADRDDARADKEAATVEK